MGEDKLLHVNLGLWAGVTTRLEWVGLNGFIERPGMRSTSSLGFLVVVF